MKTKTKTKEKTKVVADNLVSALYMCNSCSKTYNNKKEASKCCLVRKITIDKVELDCINFENFTPIACYKIYLNIEGEKEKLIVFAEYGNPVKIKDGDLVSIDCDYAFDNISFNKLKKTLNSKEQYFINTLIEKYIINEEVIDGYVKKIKETDPLKINELIGLYDL